MRMVNAIAPVRPAPVGARAKVWRAAKSAAPLVGAAALGVAAYKLSPDFQQVADSVRVQLNRSPRAFEVATSGVTFGALPDFLAQRYDGGHFRRKLFIIGSIRAAEMIP